MLRHQDRHGASSSSGDDEESCEEPSENGSGLLEDLLGEENRFMIKQMLDTHLARSSDTPPSGDIEETY
jgi:hypothetical protein